MPFGICFSVAFTCAVQVRLYYLILYMRKLRHWNVKGLQLVRNMARIVAEA